MLAMSNRSTRSKVAPPPQNECEPRHTLKFFRKKSELCKPRQMFLRRRRPVLRGGFLVEHALEAVGGKPELGQCDAGVEILAIGGDQPVLEAKAGNAGDQHRLPLISRHLRPETEPERRIAERPVGDEIAKIPAVILSRVV